MYNYEIEPIEVLDILKYGKDKYNSNNHWADDIRPFDYCGKLAASKTSLWIDQFRNNYTIINLDKNDIKWLLEAYKIGSLTGKFPNYFLDELEELDKKYNELSKKIFNCTKYFIRTEKVSLKYGQNGVGPYTNLKQIIESLVSCIPNHSPLQNLQDNFLKLYLLEWVTINKDLEFRIFVHNNKITAISQQDIYSTNSLFAEYINENRNEFIKKQLDILVDYFENVIKKKINHTTSYTIDIAIINNKPYFIEINSFGKEYAAGSALFHWLIDEDKLYNTNNNIFFRYVIDTNISVN